MADLSKLSTPDLEAISRGDMASVSTEGLELIAAGDMERRQKAIQDRVAQMEQRDAIIANGEREAKDAERRLKRAGAWSEAKSPIDGLKVMAKEVAPTALNRFMGMGVVGGSTAVGQKLGGLVGMAPVGGAVGGSLGSILEQLALVSGDPQRTINKGEILAAGMQGAITSQGAKTNAITNLAAETVRSLIDEGKMPSVQQAALAAGMGYGAAKLGNAITGKQLSPNDALMQYRHDAWRKVKDKGFVVNPMHLRSAEGVEGIVQRVAGEVPLDIGASRMNQYAIQRATREELGLPKSDNAFRPEKRNPKTGALEVPSELSELIKKASKPYEEIRSISASTQKQMEDLKAGKGNALAGKLPQEVELMLAANDNVDLLKRVRSERSVLTKNDPEYYKKLTASLELEKKIEGDLEKAVAAAGKEGLLKRFKNARVQLAKLYAVNDATNPTLGLVDISKLAEMRSTPNKPGVFLTGNLQDMADFAEAFGSSARDAIAASVDKVANSSIGFQGRQLMAGNAVGAGATGVNVLSGYARDYLLSPTAQTAAAKPRYMMKPEAMTSAALRGAGLGRELPSDPNRQP